jgi:hypothetical protein
MTTLTDIREAPPQIGGEGPLEPGPFARRCPACGQPYHCDSELAGTCEHCPGLVALQDA